MDYYLLTELATDLGYELAMSGAETFRVEESIVRVLRAYGIESEVFAIPNCLHVSFETANGKPVTRMRRIGYHGNDLEAVEQFNALSRRICAEKPEPQVARQWMEETKAACRIFHLPMYLLGNFLGGFGFAMSFGATLIEGFWSGICGIVVGLVGKLMDSLKANPFFNTIASSFLMAALAYCLTGVGLVKNVDTVIIGALMMLVPGLLFTNSMRDIIYGDTNSGINRIVQVLLIAMAIALGTAAAWSVTVPIWGQPSGEQAMQYSIPTQCLVSMIACVGFAILFNVHGRGIWLCALGGFFTWGVYLISRKLGCGVISGNFWASLFAAAYAEAMARIRKYPAISYLVVSIFPLLPGAGVYYTMRYALQGQMTESVNKGLETIGIAGIIAVSILIVSTAVRLFTIWQIKRIIVRKR